MTFLTLATTSASERSKCMSSSNSDEQYLHQKKSLVRPQMPNLDRQWIEELLAQAPAGIGLMSGPEHRWTYVNDRYVQITGRNGPADFVGKTLRESLPELQDLFIELLDEVFRTGKPYIGREMMAKLKRSPDGKIEEAYFDFVYQPVRDANDIVDGILIHAVEVTDKVLARKAIEESKERLRLAQIAGQIGTWEWDPVQDSRSLSPELHQMFGTVASDPEHANKWAARVHPHDFELVQKLMLEGHQSGSLECEYRYRHPELGQRWFYCRGSRVKGSTAMLGIVQDVTARKIAEEASERLSAIVSSSDDAIVSKDLNGIVTSWNGAAERMFGYTAAEMVGRPILTIIPPELHSDETEILQTIASGRSIEHFETVRVTKTGQRIDISLTVSPVRDSTGRIIGAAKIARDITQRKKSERALHTAERLASVGRLAATVAHEINNPLEALTNLIYLARHATDPNEVRQYLIGAEEELDRVSHLTKQTLGFYRETKGASTIRLGRMVTSMLTVFSSRMRNKGIEVIPEIRQDPELHAVPGEIRQLIANLVGNSIDAVNGNGRIRVRVSSATERNGHHRKGVRLTVADNGAGISKELQPQLFEPFFTTKKDVGTGLGLWVCKSIIEKHHGAVRIKSSTEPGKSWTVFSIFLPLEAKHSISDSVFRHAV